jgi:hypothetical protein
MWRFKNTWRQRKRTEDVVSGPRERAVAWEPRLRLCVFANIGRETRAYESTRLLTADLTKKVADAGVDRFVRDAEHATDHAPV